MENYLVLDPKKLNANGSLPPVGTWTKVRAASPILAVTKTLNLTDLPCTRMVASCAPWNLHPNGMPRMVFSHTVELAK